MEMGYMGCSKNKDNNQIAAIGIGAMIVFISMVLVAGIAASILVQTSTDLEMQALKSGQETIAQASTGLTVKGVEGFNDSGIIKKLAIEVSPKAGSPDIDLNNTIIEITDESEKHVIEFGGSTQFTNSSNIDGDIETNGKFGTATTFGVTVLQDADGSCTSSTPIIGYGDHVIIGLDTSSIFTTDSGLPPRTDVDGLVLIEEGAPGIIGFTTPSSYVDDIIELQ